MADHDFESLGDVLKRLGIKSLLGGDDALAVEDAPAPLQCARCRDVGWLSRDGHPVECPCGLVHGRRMARIWNDSQVPETMLGFTLDSFLAHPKNAEKAQLVADVRAAWDDSDRWLLFVGPVGLGKTGLAISLLLESIRSGRGGLYVVTPTFLSRIRATYTRASDGEVDELDVLRSVIEAPLLVLDDLGKVSLSEWGQEKLFTLVNDRYLAGRRTIVTSNLDLDGLEGHLWPATFDRIRGLSDVFRLTGGSLR
jgi:DNA replication protein DnaC